MTRSLPLSGNLEEITAHEGPLNPTTLTIKAQPTIMIEWENGEITSEPLGNIAADNPVTCAIDAKENSLLDQDGWKRFKGITKCEKKLLHMANQAKLHSYCTALEYKYGYDVPNDFKHAVQIDEKCGNTKWQPGCY